MGRVYIFFDTETSGMREGKGEQRYDQILQLAAVATDENLKVLGTFDQRARRKPNIVPAAGALVVTHIHPSTIDTPNLTEYQLSRTFEQWCKQFPDGITFVAWNLKFDQGMVRQMQWRALGDVYLTTNLKNHSADLLRVAKAAYCFNPESGVIIPSKKDQYEQETRRPIFKLGEIAAANGIDLKAAHDALNDTLATVEVARALKARDPKAFAQIMGLTTAREVEDFIAKNPIFQWVSDDNRFYKTSTYCTLAYQNEWQFREGRSTNIKRAGKQVVLYNLSHDPASILERFDTYEQDEAVRPESTRPLNERLANIRRVTDPDGDGYIETMENGDEVQTRLALLVGDFALDMQPGRGKKSPFQIIEINKQPILWPYTPDPATGDNPETAVRREQVSRLRDPLLATLSLDDLQARQQALLRHNTLRLILSRSSDFMWPERSEGRKLLEDRVHDELSVRPLLTPFQESGLAYWRQAFHDAKDDWAGRDRVLAHLIKDPAYPDIKPIFERPTDTAAPDFATQSKVFEHVLAIVRLGRIAIYEKELVDGTEYMKNPVHRYQVQKDIYDRLTEPTPYRDWRGNVLSKNRTLNKAAEDAQDDLIAIPKIKDLDGEERERRLAMTRDCLAYYETLRPTAPPIRPVFESMAQPPAPVAEPAPPPAPATAEPSLVEQVLAILRGPMPAPSGDTAPPAPVAVSAGPAAAWPKPRPAQTAVKLKPEPKKIVARITAAPPKKAKPPRGPQAA
jgi:hypothetical protein